SYFRPLFISVFGIVLTVAAILAYHLFLVRYFTRRGEAAADAAVRPSGLRGGVGRKVLEAIPISPFSAVRGGGGDQECVVCLGELEDGDMVRLLPDCKHAFHVTCVDQWLAAHVTCPLCRSPILAEADGEEKRKEKMKKASPPPNNRADARPESGESSARAESPPPPPPPQTATDRAEILRHCSTSLLMSSPAPPRLKRSLSMDQSFFIIDLD
ncbi:hypothetical protein M569_10153, partial [Genlisea aurea]